MKVLTRGDDSGRIPSELFSRVVGIKTGRELWLGNFPACFLPLGEVLCPRSPLRGLGPAELLAGSRLVFKRDAFQAPRQVELGEVALSNLEFRRRELDGTRLYNENIRFMHVFLGESIPFHINFFEFMLKWQALLSGLVRPLFVCHLARNDSYFNYLSHSAHLHIVPTPPFVHHPRSQVYSSAGGKRGRPTPCVEKLTS